MTSSENPNYRFMRNHNTAQNDTEKTRRLKKSYLYMEDGKITAINQRSIWKIIQFWIECKLGGMTNRN